MVKAEKGKRKALVERSEEATSVIEKLIAAGLSMEQIADASRVSKRTVYRWWREGRAPHPLMLDGLRKLSLKKGIEGV